jgi:Flp pilus assembly protein TadG
VIRTKSPSWPPVSPRSSDGQAMVEFALALPFLAVLLFTIVQFGFVLNNWVEVSQSARVGARKASLSRKSTTGTSAAIEAVRRSAAHLDQEQLDVEVTPSQPWTRATPVTVHVAYPFQVSILGFVVKSGTLTSKAVARVQ